MTKYISFKIFDTEGYTPDEWYWIKKKQVDKYYGIVHEDYFDVVIKEELKHD